MRTTVAGAALAGGALMMGVTPAMGATVGSGATFPQLVYQNWCKTLGCTYQGKGSSGGIKDFISGTVDFAGSDAVMTQDQVSQLASQRGGVTPVYIPTLLGAISVPTNTSAGRLNLDGKVLGDIFDGTITKWNDPKIAALNKGKKLSTGDITVCVRGEGSGTSYGFSNFLSKSSTAFRTKVGGASQTPNWGAPKLVKGTGNPGVAQCVKDNTDSVGYVDLGDAMNAGLTDRVSAIGQTQYVTVKKKKKVHGKVKVIKTRKVVESFLLPSGATIAAAGNLKSFDLTNPTAVQYSLVASSARNAYPITITTFILAYSNYGKAGKTGSVDDIKKFLNYAYGAGQDTLATYGFVKLPAAMLTAGKAEAAKIG
ncbi:MAG: phosphate ABC transporter substrate-binding protein PstS [Thermoleophilia bacterium]